MKNSTREVVIGGGVVGESVLFYLTKLSWSDVMMGEISELTSGSTWLATGGFHTLNFGTNIYMLFRVTPSFFIESLRRLLAYLMICTKCVE
jgi:dimethylglycine dehydrogenase